MNEEEKCPNCDCTTFFYKRTFWGKYKQFCSKCKKHIKTLPRYKTYLKRQRQSSSNDKMTPL